MRGTTVVLLLLIFTQNDANAESCPLKMCTDLLKDLGASETKLQATEKRLNALEMKQQELISRLAQSESYIKELREKPKVAFSASINTNGYFGPHDTASTLVYQNVFINVGDAYNKDTGIFTAPVRGAYYFSFFYHCSDGNPTTLELFKNGEQVASAAHPKGIGAVESAGNGRTLLLEKGDTVYISLMKNSWVWGSDNVTSFSGFLIDAM